MKKTKRWQERIEQGLRLEEEHRTEEAAEVYEAMLAEGCDTSLAYERLALIYRQGGNFAGEVRVLEAALRLVGDEAGRFAPYERRLEQARRLAGPAAAPPVEKAPTPSGPPIGWIVGVAVFLALLVILLVYLLG